MLTRALSEEDEGVAQMVVAYKGLTRANAKDLLALEVFAEVLGTGAVDAFHPARTAHRATRLGRSLTNAYAFVDAYSDAGLFGVYASADAETATAGALWSTVQREVRSAVDSLSDEDVQRAVNAVRARFAQLPSQRTVLASALHAHTTTTSARSALVAQVTRSDVARVAAAVVASAPVVAARGDVSGLKF